MSLTSVWGLNFRVSPSSMENFCENYNRIKTNTHSLACKSRMTLKINHDSKKIIKRKHVWKERNKDCMENRTNILDLERKKA